MNAGLGLRDELLAAVPHLRAFAISLTGNGVEADDLVQETLLRAWVSIENFEPGTNLNAWLFTILRNSFYSQHRKRRWEVEDKDGIYANRVPVRPDQGSRLEMEELRAALSQLSPQHREVLLLVGAEGLPYEEVAQICGCRTGTVKSRISRARARLAQLLAVDDTEEIGPDQVTRAALQSA